MKNILLIGLGYHARRIYYPILQELQKEKKINKIVVIDLLSQKEIINNYLIEKSAQKTLLFFLKEAENKNLTRETEKNLNSLIQNESIDGIIISTEPLAHTVYAKWALSKNLSILMDKPLSTYEGIIFKKNCAKNLVNDYNDLLKIYLQKKREKKNIIFSLMTQRRFHPLFQKARDSIKEVFEYTNCPITSIQIFHSDGQWRFPTEIIEQSAHPYNQGYGKCSHSGYHFFDIISWLMEAAESSEKKPDSVEISSSHLSPSDFISQLNYKDYLRLFPNFDDYNKYSEKDFKKITKNYGEIDSFNQLTFKKRKRVVTLASVNLCHNGFSQRNWITAAGRDLYKGNGRVRQEIHIIEQGPFQSLIYVSLQSKEVNPDIKNELSLPGGENHADLFVSRNSRINPSWKSFEKITVSELISSHMEGKSRGHQEEARRNGVIDFINFLNKKNTTDNFISDLTDYERTIKLISGSYLAMIKNKKYKPSCVCINLK
jgi:predicted dehydrogenase